MAEKMVIIGCKTYRINDMTVEVEIPAVWIDRYTKSRGAGFMRKGSWKLIPMHTPKWYEVRQIAKGVTL